MIYCLISVKQASEAHCLPYLSKMQDPDFLTDSRLLLRPDTTFDPYKAYEIVKTELINRLLK